MEQLKKRGNQIKIGDKEYNLSDSDTLKKEILEELKNANYQDLEYLIFRMELTYDEFLDVLDKIYFPLEKTGYTLPPGLNERSDIIKTLIFIMRFFESKYCY